jgi:hypothetical protein
MNTSLKTILAAFPHLDFVTLKHTPYILARVDLEGFITTGEKMKVCRELLRKELWDNLRALIFVHSSNGVRINNRIWKGMLDRGVDRIIWNSPREIYKVTYNTRYYIHGFGVDHLSQKDVDTLLKWLMEMDIGIPPHIDFRVYFIAQDYSKLMNIYDDRWLDIIEAGVYE